MFEKPNGGLDDIQKISMDERMYAFFKNPTNDMGAIIACKEKAEMGDNTAMLWLARMYRDGKGVRKNSSKAINLYKKSNENNILSRFELLVMLSNMKSNFKEEDIPEGLKIDSRTRNKLFIYKFNDRSMNILVKLFPFTHYNVVGFSYDGGYNVGYNENCIVFDKILIGDIYDSIRIRDDLISKGIPAEKIITVREYIDKDKFDGDAIICDFSDITFKKKAWVVVPLLSNGLLWHYNLFKTFKGEALSECNYLVDA